MLDEIRDLHRRLLDVDKDLRKLRGGQVWSRRVTIEARLLVDHYFRTVRPVLGAERIDSDQVAALDAEMQTILDTSHKHPLVTTFRRLIRDAADIVLELEKVALLDQTSTPEAAFQGADQRIIETLTKLVPAAALSYEQALRDLSEESRLSWRGPATDLRESLRETLDHLAPDADVVAQPGFKLEKDTNGPTMKQKVRYVLSKRGLSRSASDTTERAASSVDEMIGAFVRSVYTRSSVSTHTSTNKDEVLRIRDWVRVALCEILEVRG